MQQYGKNRQQKRRELREDVTREMRTRFAGTGSNGGPQWTEGMCPRRRRRSIISAATQRRWRSTNQ